MMWRGCDAINAEVRHARPCAGHPRLPWQRRKAWMAGTSPAMTLRVRCNPRWRRYPPAALPRRRGVVRLLVDQRRDAAHRDAAVGALGTLRRHLEVLLAVALGDEVLGRHLELLGERDRD